MNEQLISFLSSQRVGALATELLDGSPHNAVLHFALCEDPFVILMATSSAYKKCEALVANGKTRASFVAGVSEEEMKTFQIDGILEITTDEKLRADYLNKFPEKEARLTGPNDVIIKLTPTWWQFVDYKNPNGQLTISSTD